MEQTLVLVKPDGVKKNLIGDIIARFEHKGLQVAALKLVKVTEAQAKFHYAERRVMPGATEATAHMFIINPFAGVSAKQLFSTHPATEERVALLREQAREMGKD